MKGYMTSDLMPPNGHFLDPFFNYVLCRDYSMEALELVDHKLSSVWRFVSTNLSIRIPDPQEDDEQEQQQQKYLTYSTDEEQALEEKVNDGIATYQRVLLDTQDWIQELLDPKEADEAAEKLEMYRKQLQNHSIQCRKMLVAYRQRAKIERLEQERKKLLCPRFQDKTATNSNTNASGSVVDVTAALKRTRQIMSQEIERVSSVTKVLDDGRRSLKTCHDEYGSVNAEIIQVRKRLKRLEWQARQDKLWIGAGIVVLSATVLFIVYERTGFLLI
ncbi:hypothetical protein KXD40_000789 [Peronospora effusa]|nr:hypothetical protein KXD40_000789 [Peronospora effusa]CAI5705747.1 unnamed protein product [Peronospora effusa]